MSKTIYLDSDFKCHVSNDGTMAAVETDVFEDKCDTYVEGFRFVPYGESWTRSDGTIFNGEMIAPWKPLKDLEIAQRNYECKLLSEYKAELAELDAIFIEQQYNSLMEDL